MSTETETESAPTEPVKLVIVANNVQYLVEELPSELQELIKLYTAWELELNGLPGKHQAELEELAKRNKLELLKLEAALQGISQELKVRFQQLEEAPPSEGT